MSGNPACNIIFLWLKTLENIILTTYNVFNTLNNAPNVGRDCHRDLPPPSRQFMALKLWSQHCENAHLGAIR